MTDYLFIDGVLWVAKTGSPWRDVPAHFGAWAQVYQRFSRWSDRGHFQTLFSALQDPDDEQLMVDSTFCKAHQASSGAQKKGPQAIGMSRGGLNTKIHAVCDALGNPLRFKLTPGNASDAPELMGLIEGLSAQELLADKAYDSDAIVQAALEAGMEVVIPARANRKKKRVFDSVKYRARHLIENLFQRMKIYRRVATRYEKLDSRFLSIVHMVGAMIWLQ